MPDSPGSPDPHAEAAATPSVITLVDPEANAYVANAVVIAEQLNVRAGPGAEYPVLAQLTADEPLYLAARADGAARFVVILPDSRVGWARDDPDGIRLLVSPDSIPVTTPDS